MVGPYSTLNIVSLARGAIVELGGNKLFQELVPKCNMVLTRLIHILIVNSRVCLFTSKMDIDNTKSGGALL
jgi:hypothetical protein